MKRALMILTIGAACAVYAANDFTGTLISRPAEWKYTKTSGSSTLSQGFGDFVFWRHTNGTNAYQMTTVAVDTAALTNTQQRTVSIGAIVDGFGDVRSFAVVRFLALQAASNNVGNVKLGGAAIDPFGAWTANGTNGVTVAPGGMMMIVAPQAGYTVGTGTNLMIEATGGAATYYLYIGGNE
jgi:hypothetical protein